MPKPRTILDGMLVIDASSVIAGSYASLLMSEFGARVIKIEHPGKGDGARHLGTSDAARGLWWKFLSRNKESVTCNLSTPEGGEVFRRLAAKATVVIENFRPGTMEKWGLGYEALSAENPRLVMLRISGFGQDGPYANRPGYGTLLEAMSGIAHLSGWPDGPPLLPGIPLADAVTGMMGYGACMTALWGCDRPGGTGKGTVVDASLYGPLLYLLGSHFAETAEFGVSPGRKGNHQSNAPRNAVRCADGHYIAYSAQSQKVCQGLLDMLGIAGEERFNHPAVAYLFGDEIDRKTVLHLEKMDRKTAVETLRSHGVPVAPINDLREIMDDEHIKARQEFVATPDRARPGHRIDLPTAPVRIRGSERLEGFTGSSLGQDTGKVLGELLGLSEASLKQLQNQGAI